MLACVQPVHSALERVDVCFVLLPDRPLSQHTPGEGPCNLSRQCLRILREHPRLTLTFHVLGHAESSQAAQRTLAERLQAHASWIGVDTESLRFVHNLMDNPAALDWNVDWRKLDDEHSVPLLSEFERQGPR